MQLLRGLKRKSLTTSRKDTLALLVAKPVSTLMKDRTRNQTGVRIRRERNLHGRALERVGSPEGRPLVTLRDQPRASSRINDNYCVTPLQARLLAGSPPPRQTINTCSELSVNLNVVTPVLTAPGHSQKRDLSPGPVDCYSLRDHKLKCVKSVSCVTQLSCVQPAINVKMLPQICL